jgi:succinate dehydrogenase / fumarate reductase cytochrome b subunit
MIWTGVILGLFIIMHLFHFTFRVWPASTVGYDAANRLDVYTMVVTGLSSALTGGAYLIAMGSLFFHLSHGVQSVFQTFGLSNGFLLPRWGLVGKVLSVIFLVGFGSIPAVILARILS